MKSLSLFFTLLSATCFAQVNDSIINQMGIYLWQKDSSNYVIRTCDSYLNQTHYKTKKVEATYYKGRAYMNLKQYDSAIRCFEVAIAVPHHKLKNDWKLEWENTNAKNESARSLAKIFIIKMKYDSAIKYLDLARDKYQYHSWGPMENYIYSLRDIDMCYAKSYKGKGEYQKAIKKLEPYFENYIFVSTNTDRMMDTLYSYYLFIHSKEDVKNEFINAVNTIKLVTEKSTYDTSHYTEPMVRIFGDTIEFNKPFDLVAAEDNKPSHKTLAQLTQDCKDAFTRMYIYELATEEGQLKNK